MATLTAAQTSSLRCEPRWATRRRTDRRTLGPEVCAVMKRLGTPAMPWQRMVLDVALELEPDGSLAYREVDVTVPRQQGKTTELLGVEVHRANLWKSPNQRIYYSAQTGQDGRQKLIDDQVPVLMASPLAQLVKQVRKGIGSEGIVFENGSRIDVMASSEHSGHGKVIDLGIIDEAFSDVDPEFHSPGAARRTRDGGAQSARQGYRMPPPGFTIEFLPKRI
jgi:phage terminase large subunit-like protein